MMNVKVSRTMYFIMIINILWDKAIGATASVTARAIGPDTWISMSFGFGAGAFIILIVAYLGSKFPEKTIIKYSEELWGKLLSKIVGIILAVFFIVAYGVCANVLILHAKEYFLVETPFVLLCLIFTLLCMYAVYLGIEVIARYAFFGAVSILLMTMLMAMGSNDEFHLNYLLPLMDRGFWPDIAASVYSFGDIALAVLAAGFLYPMLDSSKKSLSLSFWAMIAGGVAVIIWPVIETGVLGGDMMQRYVFCCMEQARATELSRFFPRFELIMIVLFNAGCVVQSSIMFYCAKLAIREVTGIKKDVYVIISLAVILTGVTYFIGVDNNNYSGFLAYPWAQACAALSIGLPFLLLVTALARGKLKSKKLLCPPKNQSGC